MMINHHRSLPEAVMTVVPEAWQNDPTMPEEKRDFYRWVTHWEFFGREGNSHLTWSILSSDGQAVLWSPGMDQH